MKFERRVGAAILAAFLLICVTASLIFIAGEADHDCSGDDCPVCAFIAICRNTLRSLFEAAAVFAVTAASVGFAAVTVSASSAGLHGATPVSLKVKLLN
ncbi:MAG: AraC family transcriptional regulator [Clostridia bacterium]|nr:AraC family transcriptional regulator [Clostridia bacterium]